jgi:REP element-mobilizing transposase RayT
VVFGYHVIFGAYGFWLPNDPRGSWSDFVRSWELFRFGSATKIDSTRSVAHRPHDVTKRQAAKTALQYPEVHFTGLQARAIARGFARFMHRSGVILWACSILPEHVHLVIARHRYAVEQIANLLKGDATRQLLAEKLHPFGDRKTAKGLVPPCWARRQWKVFLDSETDIRNAITYVEQNPVKDGKPPQKWSFVNPFSV